MENNYFYTNICETFEYEIKKSKFYVLIFPLIDLKDYQEEKIKLKINEIKKEAKIKFPKATHYCYGYKIDNNLKSSDDNEPQGSAGLPILNSIINSNFNNIFVMVIRYYGGIKLGKSNLTRTYGDYSLESLNKITKLTKIALDKYEIEVDYNNLYLVEKYINNNQIFLKSYLEKSIKMTIACDFNTFKNIENILLSFKKIGIVNNYLPLSKN